MHLTVYKGAFLDLTISEPEDPAPVMPPLNVGAFLDAPVVPALNPVSVALTIRIETLMNTPSVGPTFDPPPMPLPMYPRAFMDATVLKTLDPISVLLIFDKGTTRHVSVPVPKDPVPMALTLYKGTFMEVSSCIDSAPVAVPFSLFEMAERFQNLTASSGKCDQGARSLGKGAVTPPVQVLASSGMKCEFQM